MGSTDYRVAVIIEDDPDIRRLLVEVLEQAGFETHSAGNGVDGVERVRTYNPGLTTLDVSMPGIDGFEAAKRIRAISDTYLIMLTARGDEIDTLMGLESGADDYMVKPFRPRELRARVDAMRRRFERERLASERRADASQTAPIAGTPPTTVTPAEGVVLPEASVTVTVTAPGAAAPAADLSPTPAARDGAAAPPGAPAVSPATDPGSGAVPAPAESAHADEEDGWLEHRGLRLHPEMHLVTLDETGLELTRSEFELLNLLLTTRRRVRSKADLALALRGESYVTSYYVSEADKRAVEVHLANLRRKLGESATNPRIIETVRGVGYRLTADE
ncbi:response regulator transcription factor [Agromyces aerolatus]|uniref:response regulator transcription factor n=1 Tax=Agromyces sp. LY-1074 TaxID=3074080 RepID=UPI00285A02D9|nr:MULTISPECIES: response regulator transcription factor [unclassified Agromyces]MDR5701462.1 response regulator transcription factor [Agromyces sp. LY-1074]MDR5704471.1 response regulator transcription factor [Agromyces sp. LY-1358]